jgi:hypothetical protein
MSTNENVNEGKEKEGFKWQKFRDEEGSRESAM